MKKQKIMIEITLRDLLEDIRLAGFNAYKQEPNYENKDHESRWAFIYRIRYYKDLITANKLKVKE